MVLVATQVKRRRGTTAENDAFTGAEGEIVVDTERHELRVHDGVTQGGFTIPTTETMDSASKSLDNLSENGEARFANKANSDLSNITSTGKETVVGWSMPDYANSVNITLNTSTTYTAQQNGYIVFNGTSNGTVGLSVNNISVTQMSWSGGKTVGLWCMVAKGDVVSVISTSGQSITVNQAKFVPCKEI